jgi:stress-induced-phosphoprotein 1
METFGMLIGVDVGMQGKEDEEIVMEERVPEAKPETKAEPVKPVVVEDPNIKEAAKQKEIGNDFYKAKNFTVAMKHYDNAVELDPKNIVYRLNRAAVLLETKDYENCIKECEEAIVVGRSVYASFENIGKALCRIGTAYQKLEKYPEAIAAYKESLVEFRSRDALTKLEELERLIKKKNEEAYLSDEKSLEAKKLGNECFQERKYIESLSHYAEALKRNPKDYTIYHNRATSYMKMAEFGMAQKDLTKCTEEMPEYVKAWDKLGQCYYHMKDYQKAIDSFKKGLEIDQTNNGCLEGLRLVETAVFANESDDQRAKRAMQDPEIQQIVSDPVMQAVLRDLSDPKLAQKHMQNPEVARKINKLIVSGVLGTKKKE